MLLRYHWGLGVGHTYSHIRDNSSVNPKLDSPHISPARSSTQNSAQDRTHVGISNSSVPGEPDDPDPEFSLTDQDALEWEMPLEQYRGEADIEEEEEEDCDESDDDVLAMFEMYGSNVDDAEDMD